MSCLLDSLHEDLNRAASKPKVVAVPAADTSGESDASSGGNEPAKDDHVLAEEAWRNGLKRNDRYVL